MDSFRLILNFWEGGKGYVDSSLIRLRGLFIYCFFDLVKNVDNFFI